MEPVTPEMDQKEFWNLRAKTFPRYSPDPDSYEAGMLRLAQGIGADFKGKTIIDVGCGAGMYTIRLAKEGKFVTALDISEAMLAVNREDAERENLTNVEYVNMDWLDFEPRRDYDLLFCSMTPALRSPEGKLKLLSFPKAQIVYFGFAAPMKTQSITELFEACGLKPKIHPTTADQKAFLDGHGIKYRVVGSSGRWEKKLAKDDFLLNLSTSLTFNGGSLGQIDLEGFSERFSDGQGSYVENTDYQVEVIVWENN
ncbi:MAG: class I SAM-dependent methyltransferase [Deltaproteobacteria bacterium]|jgi:SAM-dependent methyltransferase|nr:class I SAM-dependent methyltransferase [Deltaproteobacteria bacterium]